MDYLTSRDYTGATVALQRADGTRVKAGDTVTSFRGDTYKVQYITAPHKPGSTGRIGVRAKGDVDGAAEYYPGVFGLTWVPVP